MIEDQSSLDSVIFITDLAATGFIPFTMAAFVHAAGLIYLLAAFLAACVVAIVRRLRKPSCRVCLYRAGCPDRKSPLLDRGGVPCYERDLESTSFEPTRVEPTSVEPGTSATAPE
ncbi:MAG: hypothetical protein WBC78_19745 [Candidatus Sulfotelmatobacter sp.]